MDFECNRLWNMDNDGCLDAFDSMRIGQPTVGWGFDKEEEAKGISWLDFD